MASREASGEADARGGMPLSSALQGLLSLRNDSSWRKDPSSQPSQPPQASSQQQHKGVQKQRSGARKGAAGTGEQDSDSGVSTDSSTSTSTPAAAAPHAHASAAFGEMPKEVAYVHHPMAFAVPQHLLPLHPHLVHFESVQHLAPVPRKRAAEVGGGAREGEPQLVRGRYYAAPVAEGHYDIYPSMPHMARYIAAAQAVPMVMPPPAAEQARFSAAEPLPDSDGLDTPPAHDMVDDNSDARLLNLQKLPSAVVQTLDLKLQSFPGWDSRITSTKLGLLGGEVLPDSSPLLGEGERAESVTGYDPKKFHILCTKCGKRFTGKNAPRTFELHAIFWELYSAHPSFSRLQGDRDHRAMYPCNSVSRDVVVFMEAKRPCLCNNQKKIWRLQGNLHHDVSLFQGRGWIQAAADGSANVPDKTSMEAVLCCRAGKLLEQYDTLRMHVYTWHDSGVFTPCASCRRVYQNTRAYLSHGCMRKGSDEEERVLAQCAQHMTTLLDTSPEFAMWFFKMRKLSSGRRDEVFDRVSKRLRITST